MKQRVAILNFAGCNNYGANLTALALLRQCGRLGCTAHLVDRRFAYEFQEGAGIFNAFCRRYFKWTAPCYGVEYAKGLNKSYDAFIVGSDQVWAYRPDWTRAELVSQRALYDLEFAAPGKRRIAMAASFGSSDYADVPPGFREKRAAALQHFDAVSVRESSGVEICRRYLGTDALHVMDPVFFLSAAEWAQLAEHDHSPLPVRYAATCFLEENRLRPVVRKLEKLLEMPAVRTMRGSVEAWVRTIRDAAFVVTDSFHVTCFAIIFRKPFLYINPQNRGTERVPSMMQALHITFPCLSEADALSAGDAELQQQFEQAAATRYSVETEEDLSGRIEQTRRFLEDALACTPRRTPEPAPVDAAAKKLEFRRWNPFRLSVPKRLIRRSALYGFICRRS